MDMVPDLAAVFQKMPIYSDDPGIQRQRALQPVLRQRAPLALMGGREVLWHCRLCLRPWYELGQDQTLTHLSQEDLQRLTLHLRAQSPLPVALCPACAIAEVGAIPRLESDYQSGFRLHWLSAREPFPRFLCSITPLTPHRKNDVVREVGEILRLPTDLPIPSRPEQQEVLVWLAHLPDPDWDQISMLDEAPCAFLARRYPPVVAQLSWTGYGWREERVVCPGVGSALIVVACAARTPFGRDFRPILVDLWREMADTMRHLLL